MWDYIKLIVLGLIAVLAAIAANYAHDLPYMVNALVVMLAAAITFVWQLRNVGAPSHHPQNEYLDGVVRAHGANEKMIGKNLIALKDVDGKAFVQERVDLGKTKGTFWQDYKFTNPVSKKIEPKVMYCEKLGDTAVCGGVYL